MYNSKNGEFSTEFCSLFHILFSKNTKLELGLAEDILSDYEEI